MRPILKLPSGAIIVGARLALGEAGVGACRDLSHIKQWRRCEGRAGARGETYSCAIGRALRCALIAASSACEMSKSFRLDHAV